MLLRSGDLVIGQPAHAWVSGQLARAWGSAAFPAPSPREPVCLAAEQHDVGWADADLAPLLKDGRPVAFLAVPRAAHVAIWRDAARRMLAQSRYAALLVSLHGTSLYERVDPDAHPPALATQIRAYTREERALQAALSAGLDAEEIDRNRRLILALDRFSLALCHGTATTLEAVPAAGGGSATIRVEPAQAASPTAASGGGGPAGAASAPQSGAAGGHGPVGVGPAPHSGAGHSADRLRVRDDAAVPAGTATVAYAVAPWPFAAERVVVGCEARHLPGRFRDAAEAAAALAHAPWVPLRWALSPG
jgi:hypothetical protein